jgi:hypothetical protein
MTITDIKKAVENLSITEQKELFYWIDEYRENQWDKQIEVDLDNGKLNKLIAQAKQEFKEGKCQKFKS